MPPATYGGGPAYVVDPGYGGSRIWRRQRFWDGLRLAGPQRQGLRLSVRRALKGARSSSLNLQSIRPERRGFSGMKCRFRPEKTVFFDHGFETFTFD